MASPSIQQYSTRDGVIVLSNRPAPQEERPQPPPESSQEGPASPAPARLDLRTELRALETYAERQRSQQEPGGSFSWALALLVVVLGAGSLGVVLLRRSRRRSNAISWLSRQLSSEGPAALPSFELEPSNENRSGRRAAHAPVNPPPGSANTRRWASQPPPRP